MARFNLKKDEGRLLEALETFNATDEEGAVNGYWILHVPNKGHGAVRDSVFRTSASAATFAALYVLKGGNPCEFYPYKEVNGVEVKERVYKVKDKTDAEAFLNTFGVSILDCYNRIEAAKDSVKNCGKDSDWHACIRNFQTLNAAMKVATWAVCPSLAEEVTERLQTLRDSVTKPYNDSQQDGDGFIKKGVDDDWDNFLYFTLYSDVL